LALIYCQISGAEAYMAIGNFLSSQWLHALGGYLMLDNGNSFKGETLSPILVILVAGSLSLVIVN
jgi:hypothetical protein